MKILTGKKEFGIFIWKMQKKIEDKRIVCEIEYG